MTALSPSELITTSFYAWEVRGRGWQVADYPVTLEPPFRPFFILPGLSTSHDIIDDGKRPTLVSSFIAGVKSLFSAGSSPRRSDDSEPFEEPLPHPSAERDALVAFRVLIPNDYDHRTDTILRLLTTLGTTYAPIALEVVGNNHRVHIQLVASVMDEERVAGQVLALVPEVSLVEDDDLLAEEWDASGPNVVVDLGLSHEFFLPIETKATQALDPYAVLIPLLARARKDELVLIQCLFERVRNPWGKAIAEALSDGDGGCILADAPNFLKLAEEKIRTPLFAVSLRIAAQASEYERAWDLARGTEPFFVQFARSGGNELIPLANTGLSDDEHMATVLGRESLRTGMILSAEELAAFVHFPDASVRHPALLRADQRTKALPPENTTKGVVLGENVHRGKHSLVTLGTDERLQHTWVIGASGSGKSHLLISLIVQDLVKGEGLAVLDPHGDLIDDILRRVPDNRQSDVVLFDPADASWPLGFNILSATSEIEKNLIASDVVGVFRRLSSSWGDTMGTVLGNAVLAILESPRGGTLLDLRRFLVDERFRKEYLTSIEDEEICFFWQKEYPLIGSRSIGPILTRLDTFLRPKLIRHIVGQRDGRLHLQDIMDGRKIFLAKLSQGLIGEENSFLLGSLLLGKFQELAVARQDQARSERKPFFLYADEFQQFITPSLETLLTGARKYGIGLTLAHQTLAQLSATPRVESALFGNAYTRIVFRTGEQDARRFAEGFSFFEARDIGGLARGEALVRFGSVGNDCNLKTLALPPLDSASADQRPKEIVARSRQRYGTAVEVLKVTLRDLYGAKDEGMEAPVVRPLSPEPTTPSPVREIERASESEDEAEKPVPKKAPPKTERARTEAATMATSGRGGQEHKYLQHLVKRLAEERGFRATIEEAAGSGRADVVLRRESLSIAVEISITTDIEHEKENFKKCDAAGFSQIIAIVPDKRRREKFKREVKDLARVPLHVIGAEDLPTVLDELNTPTTTESAVRGYKVKVTRQAVSPEDIVNRRAAMAEVIARSIEKQLSGN